MRHNLSYAIMFHIGILDLIQLIGHIASAVFVFSQSTFHPLVNKVSKLYIASYFQRPDPPGTETATSLTLHFPCCTVTVGAHVELHCRTFVELFKTAQ